MQRESGGRRPWREGRGEREKETFNTAFPNETTKRESREKEGGGKKGRRRRKKGGKKNFIPWLVQVGKLSKTLPLYH